MLNLAPRTWSAATAEQLRAAGHPALLARLYAARGIGERDAIKTALTEMLPFPSMLNCAAAGARLADAIRDKQRILVLADYDALCPIQ